MHRALAALGRGATEPWNAVEPTLDPQAWKEIVALLRDRGSDVAVEDTRNAVAIHRSLAKRDAEWRERRALVALYNGDPTPWRDLDPKAWVATVTSLQEQKLVAGRALTDAGRRVVDDLLFRQPGPPAGSFGRR